MCKDATIINYENLLRGYDMPYDIDYLQIDCEPPHITYQILLSIPFEKYRFGVITFEHDHYLDISRTIRDKSREYLKSMGYILMVPNIQVNDKYPFEDWWIHPDLINEDIIRKLQT